MDETHIKAIVEEFLKLGLFEEWLESKKQTAVEAFGQSTSHIVAHIEAYHSSRQTLLMFQQFLESRIQKTEN
jgi:hypothetical protein